MTHDGLRDAWSQLQPKPPPDEVGETDELTRRTVDWMRAALSTQRPAITPLPVRRPRERQNWRPLAAAALVLVLLGDAVWLVTRAPRDELMAPPVVAAPSRVIVASADAEKLELRSGPVRFLLLSPAGPPPAFTDFDAR